MIKKSDIAFFVLFLTLIANACVYAMDNEITRQTLRGMQSLYVAVEEIQPNVVKYGKKIGLTSEQIKKDVEIKLKTAGIKALSKNEWLITPGRPMLYLNINFHEYEKYWYAYDIKLEISQIVFLERNLLIKTMANTWSINMTGVANVGTLNSVRNNAGKVVDRLIEAYNAANRNSPVAGN